MLFKSLGTTKVLEHQESTTLVTEKTSQLEGSTTGQITTSKGMQPSNVIYYYEYSLQTFNHA